MSILLGALGKLLPTNTDSLSVDCFITLSNIFGFYKTKIIVKGDNHKTFFTKVLILVIEPFVFVIIGFIIWRIVFKKAKKNSEEFKKKLITTVIVITYILQPGLLKEIFKLFK